MKHKFNWVLTISKNLKHFWWIGPRGMPAGALHYHTKMQWHAYQTMSSTEYELYCWLFRIMSCQTHFGSIYSYCCLQGDTSTRLEIATPTCESSRDGIVERACQGMAKPTTQCSIIDFRCTNKCWRKEISVRQQALFILVARPPQESIREPLAHGGWAHPTSRWHKRRQHVWIWHHRFRWRQSQGRCIQHVCPCLWATSKHLNEQWPL